MIEARALQSYKIPLCFREADDDLAVDLNEADNILD